MINGDEAAAPGRRAVPRATLDKHCLIEDRTRLRALPDTRTTSAWRDSYDHAAPAALAIDETHREWSHRRLALTDLGRDFLTGNRHWLDHVSGERWVGGIRIAPRREAARR